MTMKKFINDPENLTPELLEGLALANPTLIKVVDNMIINKKLAYANRVTIVTVGGTGHEPGLEGFVGEGMIDIAVVGDIFESPEYKTVAAALKIADRGKGVLLVVLNHADHMLIGDSTLKEIEKLGLNVIRVVTQEDINNAPRSDGANRRGLVGCVPLYKIAGAAAAQGRSLKEVAELAQNFADNMATVSVVCKTATHPQNGQAFVTLEDDEMQIFMGQDHEGGGRQKLRTADETAEIMAEALINDLDLKSGEGIMVIVNGTGGTTLMEMLVVFRKVHQYLAQKDIIIVASWVEEILTFQEQAGFQLFFARMDGEKLACWEAPTKTPYLTR